MKEETKKIAREKPISDEKKEMVKELSDKIESSRTVLLASCRSLPGQQFHEIKKKLRGRAEIKMTKKSVMSRAINASEKGYIQNLKKELTSDIAIFFSELDPFELSALLTENQSPAKAKANDLAPEDIEIEAGPTSLLPGPAISELSSVGLKVAVKEGKLEIIKGAVVIRKGEKINSNLASVLGKLDIKPMKVGFIPIAAYDSKDDKLYVGIKVDKEETLEELRQLIKKALGFALRFSYTTKETISYLIAKASAEERALEGLIKQGSKEEIEKKEDLNNKDNQEEKEKK